MNDPNILYNLADRADDIARMARGQANTERRKQECHHHRMTKDCHECKAEQVHAAQVHAAQVHGALAHAAKTEPEFPPKIKADPTIHLPAGGFEATAEKAGEPVYHWGIDPPSGLGLPGRRQLFCGTEATAKAFAEGFPPRTRIVNYGLATGMGMPQTTDVPSAPPQSAWHSTFTATMDTIRVLHDVKNGEYADHKDHLANFRKVAASAGLPMASIWHIYAGKHWLAIENFIRDLREKTTRPRSEPIEGRIHDLIVYLILLKMILSEGKAGAMPGATPAPAGDL